MKRLLLLMLFLSWPLGAVQAEESLQQKIDALPEGAVIELEAGVYNEAITIKKPLTINGADGAVFRVEGEKPAISIENTENVAIRNVQIEQGDTALLIQDSSNVTVERLRIIGADQAASVHRSKKLVLRELSIEGPDGHYSDKGNGIALYKSEDIEVSDNEIRNVRDGIYIEHAKGLRASGNSIQDSRYGVHLMYSEQVQITGNHFSGNVTGVMLMMSNDSRIHSNIIEEHIMPNASGLVLYDADTIEVTDNSITSNALGLSLQKTGGSTVAGNRFFGNQIGMEFINSAETNKTKGNEFTGNIIQLRSDARGGQIAGNYYDDAALLDLDEDGYGDTPYTAMQSYGQWMVREPVYQYFTEAPAVVLLNEMDREMNRLTSLVLIDNSPLMEAPSDLQTSASVSLWRLVLGAAVMAFAAFIWRKESAG
ncbi:right-handed parallel beta-helix repeat-containing protein [Planococcus sp. ISL-109]|uniref:right-handed parallel beta-helix repeat-containing protein n=1 Tax=Planococcus sp. ISL-109 TaxID=2819166 RepID=UPI001BEB08D1|nr:right-handed parallel beta-helix repeat-containing protein [Planococcus sp. ISL-109]MBT2583263.1 right-handed parallel beta-helix repeat-containing protein [Planococcus sp. ISL-109]